MLLRANVDANRIRESFIADRSVSRRPSRVRVYQLVVKAGSYNLLPRVIQGAVKRIKAKGGEVVPNKPEKVREEFFGPSVMRDLSSLKQVCDVVLADRRTRELMMS